MRRQGDHSNTKASESTRDRAEDAGLANRAVHCLRESEFAQLPTSHRVKTNHDVRRPSTASQHQLPPTIPSAQHTPHKLNSERRILGKHAERVQLRWKAPHLGVRCACPCPRSHKTHIGSQAQTLGQPRPMQLRSAGRTLRPTLAPTMHRSRSVRPSPRLGPLVRAIGIIRGNTPRVPGPILPNPRMASSSWFPAAPQKHPRSAPSKPSSKPPTKPTSRPPTGALACPMRGT